MIVVDTHILLWFLLDDRQLNKKLKHAMVEDPGAVYVSAIVVWECLVLAQRGRVELKSSEPAAALRSWIRESGFRDTPVTSEIATLGRVLPFEHDDPADRFIAATAYALEATLATDDRRLRALPWIQLAY